MVDFLAGDRFRPSELRPVFRADEIVGPSCNPVHVVVVLYHPTVNFLLLVTKPVGPTSIFGDAPASTFPVFTRSTIWPPLRIVNLQLSKGLLWLVLWILERRSRQRSREPEHGR